MRYRPDGTDLLMLEWARVRRRMYGVVLPSMIEPRERLGKLRSTLGSIREEGEGAAQGTISQSWPEVHSRVGLVVQRLWVNLGYDKRRVVEVHYVWWELPLKERVKSTGMSRVDYLLTLNAAKEHIFLNFMEPE